MCVVFFYARYPVVIYLVYDDVLGSIDYFISVLYFLLLNGQYYDNSNYIYLIL